MNMTTYSLVKGNKLILGNKSIVEMSKINAYQIKYLLI